MPSFRTASCFGVIHQEEWDWAIRGKRWQDPCRDEAILNWWNHLKARERKKWKVEITLWCFFTVSKWDSLVAHDAYHTLISYISKKRKEIKIKQAIFARYASVSVWIFTVCPSLFAKMISTLKPSDMPAIFTLDLFLPSHWPKHGLGRGFDAEVPGQFPCSQHANRHVSLPARDAQLIDRPPEGPQPHQR